MAYAVLLYAGSYPLWHPPPYPFKERGGQAKSLVQVQGEPLQSLCRDKKI